MPNEDETKPSPKSQIKTESSVEEAVEAVAAQVSKSKSPLLTIAAIVVPLLAGGSMGFGGWTAQSEAKIAYESLTKKVDKLGEDLQNTTKELAAAATRAQAERHEERIRKLEEQAQQSILERTQLRLELAALKAAPK